MINVQRLEMELIHMPHTSDNDKKARDNNAKRTQKMSKSKKIFSKVNVHTLKRPITFDSIVHQQLC